MGHGYWRRDEFADYARRAGRTVAADGSVAGHYSAQEMYRSRSLSPVLDPKGVIRECCDGEDHPNTLPVILALDVTGSMGTSAVEIAKKLNIIMTELYNKVEDVEFMIMGIGDFMYDRMPLQVSQFESDIRIAEQLDQLCFEGGGGGNNYESYTAAWYFASRHTRLDCWKRGKKGLIITMGDEILNPYLPLQGRNCNFASYMGDNLQDNVETNSLYKEVTEKYEVCHLVVDHDTISHNRVANNVTSFAKVIGKQNVHTVTTETLADTIVERITAFRDSSINLPSQEKKGTFEKLLDLVSW